MITYVFPLGIDQTDPPHLDILILSTLLQFSKHKKTKTEKYALKFQKSEK